jgi:hypothetical protein
LEVDIERAKVKAMGRIQYMLKSFPIVFELNKNDPNSGAPFKFNLGWDS